MLWTVNYIWIRCIGRVVNSGDICLCINTRTFSAVWCCGGGGGCIGMLACTEPRYRVFKAKFSFAKMSAINDDNVNNGTKSSQSLCFRENEKFLKTKFHINPTQTFPAMQIPELAIKFPKPIIIIMKLCIGRWPSLHGQDTSHHIWTQQRQSPIERQSPYCSMAAPIERQSVEWLSL